MLLKVIENFVQGPYITNEEAHRKIQAAIGNNEEAHKKIQAATGEYDEPLVMVKEQKGARRPRNVVKPPQFPFLDRGQELVIFSNGCLEFSANIIIGYMVLV